MVICLKTQLEEAKKNEEAWKIQLTKMEEPRNMLELEIINVKKINESNNLNLMTQIEEAKKNEEAQKIQLTTKEETCHMLEIEVINLKKKNEKTKETVKFQNNSIILDRIWNNQRPIDDKIGLGYNKK
jgi:hypothetical protein